MFFCVTIAFAIGSPVEQQDAASTTSAPQTPAIHAIAMTDEKSSDLPVDTSKELDRKTRGITIGVGGIGLGGGAIVEPGICVYNILF